MKQIRVLSLEDMPTDAELIVIALQRGNLDAETRRVYDEESFRDALCDFKPDIILADYHVPGFSGLEALQIRNRIIPDIPFIFVTGSLGDERAVETLREGATDFILKDRMGRLPNAVGRALEDARIKAELESERILHHTILATAQSVIVALDEQGQILHANDAAARFARRSAADIIGRPFWECFVDANDIPDTRQNILDMIDDMAGSEPAWQNVSREGRIIYWTTSTLHALQHPLARLVLCGTDITEQQHAQEKAYFLDHFDAATNLPNRRLFLLQLQQYCSQVKPGDSMCIVTMIVGIGRIQDIRDNYGENIVQDMLVEIAQRLRTWQVHRELLARLGELSFALTFEVEQELDLEQSIPFILRQLHEPIIIDGTSWVLPAHVGVSLLRRRQSSSQLVMEAEAALHDAQARGIPYVCFNPHLSSKARENLLLETELHQVIHQPEQFVIYYQPQVDARTHQLIGLEALVRWRHPRLGLLLPGRFVPLAEIAGLMPELGQVIVRSVCRQIQAWQNEGLTPPPVAVNISASEFSSPGLVRSLQDIMFETGVAPHGLELELTESASMQNPEVSIAIMNQLIDIGIRLSIDDFGTGYSNLSYLKRFPVNRLKLDQAFVRDILTDNNDLAISQAIIAMAHQLRLEVVAEGVENIEQLKLLSQFRCDHIQGYLFSRPQPAENCRVWLEQGMVSPAIPVLPA